MEAKPRDVEPRVVTEGLEILIERDLEKHKTALELAKANLEAFERARTHEIAKKKYYRRQIGGGKYNDEALRASMEQMRVNITHLSNRVKEEKDRIAHETLVVDTLTRQMAEQIEGLEALARYRISHAVRN